MKRQNGEPDQFTIPFLSPLIKRFSPLRPAGFFSGLQGPFFAGVIQIQTVNPANRKINPVTINIPVGDVVQWIWTGAIAHLSNTDLSCMASRGKVKEKVCIAHGGVVTPDCSGGVNPINSVSLNPAITGDYIKCVTNKSL